LQGASARRHRAARQSAVAARLSLYSEPVNPVFGRK
jgi:hypothetical protein